MTARIATYRYRGRKVTVHREPGRESVFLHPGPCLDPAVAKLPRRLRDAVDVQILKSADSARAAANLGVTESSEDRRAREALERLNGGPIR